MRTHLVTVIRKLNSLLIDIAHGIDAGNAIRHGLDPATQSTRRCRRA